MKKKRVKTARNVFKSQSEKIRRIINKLHESDANCTIAIALPRRNKYLDNLSAICRDELVTTIHSLKGLEADHVILANLDEDEFNFSNEYTQEDTNRHLLYVGMTRAKKSLTMLSATVAPSRTLYELSADYVELDESENPNAHKALTDMRLAQARKARAIFENLARKKAESEEAVERVTQSLKDADTEISSNSKKDEYIAELEQKLRIVQKQLARDEERFQRQEDELRVFREREISDKATRDNQKEKSRAVFADNAKILILGASSGVKAKDIPAIFKSAGLPRDAFELFSYDDIHSGKFNTRNLLDTIQYSDIFVSTTPHKAKGIGDSSSLVEFLEDNKNNLPKLKVFRNEDGTLKAMSKTDLKVALMQSNLYAAKKDICLE